MLKGLISGYGKEKINSLTKYPSILKLHDANGSRGTLTSTITTDFAGERVYATEKIDGANVRIVMYGGEYLIGSREYILYHNHDLYYDPSFGIVDAIHNLSVGTDWIDGKFTIVYGEIYGGKLSSSSKNYGTDTVGFRVFDVAQIDDLSILDKPIEEISRWREHESPGGLVYGQKFFNVDQMVVLSSMYSVVPSVEFELGSLELGDVLHSMNTALPETLVALSDTARKVPEGLIIRNYNRSKIAKIRFEDYNRTLIL